MKDKKKIKKIILLLLLLTISVSLIGVVYQINSDAVVEKQQRNINADEKSKILIELVKLNSNYNNTIIENSLLYDEIIIERQRVLDFMTLVNSYNQNTKINLKIQCKLKIFKERQNDLIERVALLKKNEKDIKKPTDSLIKVNSIFNKKRN